MTDFSSTIRAVRSMTATLALLGAGLTLAQPEPTDGSDSIEAELARCQEIEHGQPAFALDLARELLRQPEVDESPIRKARALGCRGWAEAQLGDSAAAATTDELSALLPDIENVAQRASIMRRVAGLQQQTNQNAESIETLMTALDLVNQEGLDGERISLLINLAIAHSEARNHDQAIGHYRTALEALAEDDGRRMPVLYNLGLTLRGAERTDEAKSVFQQLVEPLSAPGLEIRLASLFSVLGSIEIELDNLDAAEDYLARSDALHDELDNPGEHAALLIEWSDLSLERGDPDAAIQHAREALAEAERADFVPSIRGALRTLAAALVAGGRYEEAVQVQRRYVAVSDEFLRNQMEGRLEDAEARYGNERQARELAELRQERQEQDFTLRRQQLRQRLLLGLGIAGVLIAIGAFAWQRGHTRRLRRLSRTDPLTGLPNRRQLMEWLDRLRFRQDEGVQNRADRSPRLSVIWLLDLDHFKRVNDSCGHDIGDRALVELGRLLKRFAESHSARAGRWGGEEFVLIGGVDNADEAARVAETLRRAVARLQPLDRAGNAVELSASIGFAPLIGIRQNSGQNPWEPAMMVADQMLYRAKQAGRNTWMGLWPNSETASIVAHDVSSEVRSGRCELLERGADDSTPQGPGSSAR